jgi:hypothetical protein
MEQQPQQPPPPAAPPAQPAWGQPPAGPVSGWVQPTAAAARGPVTGLAKLGALVLILFGLLWTALGALVVLGGAILKGVGDQAGGTVVGDAFGGVLAGLGIVVLAIAIVEIIVGIAAWMGKEWARIVGIIYALIFGGGCLLSLLTAAGSSRSTGTDATGGVLILLVFAVAYIYTLVVFALRWRGRATA